MKKIIAYKKIWLLALFSGLTINLIHATVNHNEPRVTVVFIIDQGAYSYIPKLSPYLNGGLKYLLKLGVTFHDAHYPHSLPSTAPGHTCLNVGTTPDNHGIIGNSFRKDGKNITSDCDCSGNALVFSPDGVYEDEPGRSAINCMVDGLSDQMILSSQPSNKHLCFSFSYKSRAAIGTAGRLGKAVWFCKKSKCFTSSQAYFNELPEWIKEFNEKKAIYDITKYKWNLAYPSKKRPYDFCFINNYEFSESKEPMAGTTSMLNGKKDFIKTPLANQVLLDLAMECIEQNITRTGTNSILVWVCLSTLDTIGHDFGPFSKEAIDMWYHLDKQLDRFIQKLNKRLNRTEILYALSADHGICPIPELLEKEHYSLAHRIQYEKLVGSLNEGIKSKFNIADLIIGADPDNFYFDLETINGLEKPKRKELYKHIKAQLLEVPGVLKVWTARELQKSTAQLPTIEACFKHQYFPGRSGQIIIQPQPYCPLVAKSELKGTSHRTPYSYDTHVPIIIYQKDRIEYKQIYDMVLTTQFAPTMAHLMGIAKPSACTFPVLPGIIQDRSLCW